MTAEIKDVMKRLRKTRRTTEATDRLGLVYVDDELFLRLEVLIAALTDDEVE